MQVHVYKIFIILLLLIIPASASITINDSNYYINITNANITFHQPQTFDSFGIGSNYIEINSKTLQITSSNNINITINQFITSTDYYNISVNGTGTVDISQEVSIGLADFRYFIDGIQQSDITSTFFGYVNLNAIIVSTTPSIYLFYMGTTQSDLWKQSSSAVDLWISLGRLLMLVVMGLIISFIVITIKGIQNGTLGNQFKILQNIGIGILILIIIYGVITIIGSMIAEVT